MHSARNTHMTLTSTTNEIKCMKQAQAQEPASHAQQNDICSCAPVSEACQTIGFCAGICNTLIMTKTTCAHTPLCAAAGCLRWQVHACVDPICTVLFMPEALSFTTKLVGPRLCRRNIVLCGTAAMSASTSCRDQLSK